MKYIFPYTPRFIVTCIYMLQNTEYSVREFIPWLWSAQSLEKVMSHRTVTWTQKAKILRLVLAVAVITLYVVALLLVVGSLRATELDWSALILGVAVLLATPLLAVHLLMVPLFLGSVLIQRPKERAAYARAKNVYAELDIPVIAIAGSFGKTSLRNVLVSVLAAGKTVATPRNNHNTPMGLSLFADEITDDAEVAVIELGEYVPGDVAYLAELVSPQIGVISGINRQHMQRMKTKQRTIDTIMELADYVDSKKLYINIESDWAKEAAHKSHVSFSSKSVGKWKLSDIESDLDGSRFTLTKGKRSIELTTSVLGAHQIAPIAASAVIAESLGLTDKQIRKGVASITAFERRFEPIKLADDVLLIDDTYNGNPSGFEAGMDFLDSLDHDGRKIYATAGIIELGSERFTVHEELGARLAQKSIDHIIFFDTPLSRVMHDSYIMAEGTAEVTVVEDQVSFRNDLEHFVRPGDVVLMQNSQREDYFYQQ